jgi:hydrogenase expression/formation protein HypD
MPQSETMTSSVSAAAKEWLDRIRALPFNGKVRVLSVCGGHERTISMAGLRHALPPQIELIAGPGCPVCVCPEEDVHDAIALALRDSVTLVAFGDMLRVPANVPKSEPRSLEAARAQGGDVRPIASPREAAAVARANPGREVVFFAAGFETTTAPIAAMIAEGVPPNLSVLLSARRTWPAVAMLLDSEQAGFEALIAPGHVCAIMGPEEWRFVPERHGIAASVAGFEVDSLIEGLHSVLRQHLQGRALLDNCYANVAKPGGNPTARRLIRDCLDVVDANWRGIGVIPRSGFALKPELERLDARRRFALDPDAARKRAGEMPPGCDCARVVLGKIHPNACRLYGKACTPRTPVGPCMVSDEGACRIWWASGQRHGAKIGA